MDRRGHRPCPVQPQLCTPARNRSAQIHQSAARPSAGRRMEARGTHKPKSSFAMIAGAPANGLKPDLFLKGCPRTGRGADCRPRCKYASALAKGYADPKKISRGLHDPAPKCPTSRGPCRALRRGPRRLVRVAAPQTDEYRALSQAHLHYLQAGGQDAASAGRRGQADQARQARYPASLPRSVARGASAICPPQPQQPRHRRPAANRRARRGCEEGAGRIGDQAGRRHRQRHAGRTERRTGLPGTTAGNRDGASALAAARSARRRGSTSTRLRHSSITSAMGSTSITAT